MGKKVKDSFTLMPGDEIKVAPFSMLFIGPDQLQAPSSIGGAKDEQSHFSGQLQTLKVVDLVQLINSTGQSGLLNLRDTRNKTARLIFVRGEIVSATYSTHKDEDAVYSILGLNDGEFDFIRGEQTMPTDPIRKKTQALLFEGCQMKDENRIPGVMGAVREPSRKSTQPLSMPVDLSK